MANSPFTEVDLIGRTVAILATDGVEQVELTVPRDRLIAAGAQTGLVSLDTAPVTAYRHLDKADDFEVDRHVDDVSPQDFDALLLPGGVANPDTLRTHEPAVAFVKAFAESGKPIAAICHAPWILIEAGVVEGRRMTSYKSVATDLRNAGATWVDEEAVVDGNILTSRNPGDLDAFCDRMLSLFSGEGAPDPSLIAP